MECVLLEIKLRRGLGRYPDITPRTYPPYSVPSVSCLHGEDGVGNPPCTTTTYDCKPTNTYTNMSGEMSYCVHSFGQTFNLFLVQLPSHSSNVNRLHLQRAGNTPSPHPTFHSPLAPYFSRDGWRFGLVVTRWLRST